MHVLSVSSTSPLASAPSSRLLVVLPVAGQVVVAAAAAAARAGGGGDPLQAGRSGLTHKAHAILVAVLVAPLQQVLHHRAVLLEIAAHGARSPALPVGDSHRLPIRVFPSSLLPLIIQTCNIETPYKLIA